MLALALCGAAALPARAQLPALPEWPAELVAGLPAAQALGSARLTFWGLDVYDARLWVAPGFRVEQFARHALALELRYLRKLQSADIARRSIDEMRRAGPLPDALAESWQQQLRTILPDVLPGDRILGLHRPGQGADFWVNGKLAGEIRDPAFSARFFGIWLGTATSEPRMRQRLLSGAPSP